MRNPWLDIPLADYEGHMAMPDIGQAALIADQLGVLIARFRPASVAIVGCAGGNGFDCAGALERLVGVDINPRYIEQAASRYSGHIRGLELHVADIQQSRRIFEPVDLIYAALVFEYVDVARTMQSLARHCVRGGILATVVQLPHESKAAVTPSPYTSLQQLAPALRLVSPDELAARASEAGLVPEDATRIASPGGKLFAAHVFRAA